VIHTHSTHLVACSLRAGPDQAELLPPITPYFVMKVGRVPHISYHRPGAAEPPRTWHAPLRAMRRPAIPCAP
jgi:ribulose-5-phosphate 4-epimerase/fuculose-1-phosphate aldolase